MQHNLIGNINMISKLASLPGYGDVNFAPLQPFVGIKEIQATPLTRGKYNELQGWEPPVGEDQSVKGYLVVYPDGYVSWSPAETFEDAYRTSGNMSYSMALYLLQEQSATRGIVIYRSGWNGKNQYVMEVDGQTLADGINRNYGDPSNPDNNPEFDNALFLKNAQGKMFPWTPSTGDANAKDWCIAYL